MQKIIGTVFIVIFFSGTALASEIRHMSYSYAYEFAKGAAEPAFVVCDNCPPRKLPAPARKTAPSIIALRVSEPVAVTPEGLSVNVPEKEHDEREQRDGTSNAEKNLKKTFPQFSFDSFRESPVKDMYEIVAGDQIFYFSPDGYLFFGELWSKEGISVTARRKEEVMAARAKELPLEKAVRIGSGRNVVVEFTDPDCPHCRKAYEYLAKRTDITHYVFFFPLEQLHPDAAEKAKYVLCAENPGQAYGEVMSGKLDGTHPELPAGCDKEGILNEHIKAGKKVGVRGTPAFFVNGTFISGANMPRIEKLLAE